MNDLYGITVENLMSVFPPSMQSDEKIVALATTTARAIAGSIGESDYACIYLRLDLLPDEVLDTLAKDFDVQWYDYDAEHSVKVKLISSSFLTHRHLGTKAAVVSVLNSLFEDAQILEWFEYGGDPYTCKIVIGNGENWCDTDILKKYLHSIECYKNLRTDIKSANYSTSKLGTIYVGTAMLYQETMTIPVTESWPENNNVYITDENGYFLIDEDGKLLMD